jgi:hypothetical protein
MPDDEAAVEDAEAEARGRTPTDRIHSLFMELWFHERGFSIAGQDFGVASTHRL